jgi:molecular chaperone GrpE (heat shock protein)
LDKEEQAIDEANKAAETERATEPTDENSEGSQTEPEPESPQTKPVDVHLNAIATVNQNLVDLQEQFDKQIARNQTQQQMFETQQQMFEKFYQEIEANKEDALFEAFHKPVIHNLIQLYDHFVEVEAQLKAIFDTFEIDETQNADVSDPTDETQNADVNDPFNSLENWFEMYGELNDGWLRRSAKSNQELMSTLESLRAVPKDSLLHFQKDLLQFQKNLEIVRLELEEVLYRMNVTPYDEHPKKLDRKLHKTLGTEETDDSDLHMHVAEIRKIGFYWSKAEKQVIRPEEVIIYRYKPSADEPE